MSKLDELIAQIDSEYLSSEYIKTFIKDTFREIIIRSVDFNISNFIDKLDKEVEKL